MGVLASARNRKGQTPGRWIMVPRSEVTTTVGRRSRIIRRRRQNFERLLAASAITLLAGFIPHLRWIWFVHLAVDGVFGMYISRLLRYKREEQERKEKVAELPTETVEPAQNVSSG
jgi:type III secretory pathway component EscV